MQLSGALMQGKRERGVVEFVLTTSGIMMLIALAIDAMLPALPHIGASLGVTEPNARQWVITVFMVGFGVGQLVIGPVTDAFGRRSILLAALVLYSLASIGAAASTDFGALLAMRTTQGLAAAGARIVVVAMVRDRFVGEAMAQIMSFSQVVFMAAPIFAPLLGQIVIEVADWRWIFIGLAAIGAALLVLSFFRVDDTLPHNKRQPVSASVVLRNWGEVLRDRGSRYYTLAGAMLNVVFMGFLVSVQQIFADIIGNVSLLPYGFAILAGAMAIASLINGSIVKRYGMLRICRVAIGAYVIVASLALVSAFVAPPSFAGFIAVQAALMVASSFTGANLGALAMRNMGQMAGAAAALQGSFSIAFGTFWGGAVGQAFKGSTVPLYAAALLCGLIAAAIIYLIRPEPPAVKS
jgi:MFS transporter, DHA1 family, multidrug resistance protein